MNKHADSAACKGQESVREPNDYLPAGPASLDKHGDPVAHALLNLIHPNTIHQPRNDSLHQLNHRMQSPCPRLAMGV